MDWTPSFIVWSILAFSSTPASGNPNQGCNGVPHGIACCEEDFVVGDNAGGEEMFIQADMYTSSCIHTCKTLYPRSVGITESTRQQYSSGPGRNKNKCWCEFGTGKLDSNSQGYKTCMFEETVLFLVSGTGSHGRSMVLSLPDFAPIRSDIKPVRKGLGLQGSVAAVIDKKLMVCGGALIYGDSYMYSEECYTLNNGTEWTRAPFMSKLRNGAASTKFSERAGGGWWVTGARDNFHPTEGASTEVFENGEWHDGPQLPEGVFNHCLFQLNWNSFLLVGGVVPHEWGKNQNGGTYILRDRGYDPPQIISGVPDIGLGCACAMLGNEAYVAGGVLGGQVTTKVHIFSGSEERNYDDLAWREGPELPAPIYFASLVAYDNHIYLLGGYIKGKKGPFSGDYNKIIYKLDEGEWTAVASSPPKIQRYDFPALVVPKQIIQ